MVRCGAKRFAVMENGIWLSLFVYSAILSVFIATSDFNYSEVNIPKEHMPFFFYNFPEEAFKCAAEIDCKFKDSTLKKQCWGYEKTCRKEFSYSIPACPGDYRGWARSKEDHIERFYRQADFGYIRERINEMQTLCEPFSEDDSSLECTDHLRFCRGRNIMINFTDLSNREEPIRYAMDVLKRGQVAGFCKLDEETLQEHCDHISPLQSWGPELRNFVSAKRNILKSGYCDVIVDKPTFILKIDATVNMYHHFCDFFNLYASLHLNGTHPNMFSRDLHILIWESYTYFSNFAPVMDAFTKHPVWDLKTFSGKTVCFRDIVFPLLPRMIFGLFYNTPVVWGCEKSGLFHAFSKHILHNLQIPLHPREDDRIRITVLSRKTKYRRILNEDTLIRKIRSNPLYVVKKVVYTHQMSFREQLEITHNSDIFIGMHGSGLTHLLFLPDWAAVFELYNCEDENCYMDLARLRGLGYFTWEEPYKLYQEDEGHHPEMGAHAKFTNYAFDVDEFAKIVQRAAFHVQNQQSFKDFVRYTHDNVPSFLHEEL